MTDLSAGTRKPGNTLRAKPDRRGLSARHGLVLAALGVVYGDIGTSPLYAIRQSILAFGETGKLAILGILSLMAWALILVVTLKYVLVIMRADNHGEGGLLALTALTLRTTDQASRRYRWITVAGLVGGALFYGDAVLTPAISVLSAVEGLKVATPFFEPYVIPISLGLLLGLFIFQSRGTAAVGRLFGPVMLLWFFALALLGIVQIARHPQILHALNPLHGFELFLHAPWQAFLTLGAVFLAVTGAEALYADMGHFGRRPMSAAWLRIVFPALLLNYFGQGALLLRDPGTLQNPFYHLAPEWGLYPLIALAAAATIIASQAVISGAFSISRQAILLGYLPRFRVKHTAREEIGQIYVPVINWLLFVAVVLLVMGFGSSDDLGAAYGISISGMMIITSVLAFLYARRMGWSLAATAPLFGVFLMIDAAFLGSNLLKIAEGGWFSLLAGAAVFTIMSTWWQGRRTLLEEYAEHTLSLQSFLDRVTPRRPRRVPGTAIVLVRNIERVPVSLLHAVKHFSVMHEVTVLMTVQTEDVPHVGSAERMDIQDRGCGIYTIRVHYGFMDNPNIPRALAQNVVEQHFRYDVMKTSFIIGRVKLLAARRGRMARWRKQLFILLRNNMLDATDFYRLPPNRVVEMGGQMEI